MRAGGKIRGHAASRQAKLEPIYDRPCSRKRGKLNDLQVAGRL
jgi:hypothetical protein